MKRRIIGAFLGLALVVSLSSCSFIDGLIVRTTTTTTTQPTSTTVTPTVTTSKQTAYESTIPSNNPNGYKIKYINNNGTIYTSTSNKENKIIEPADPVKNYATFLYWCSDEECNNKYDFKTIVTKETTIYAKYNIDYKALTNAISSNSIKANVQINHQYRTSGFGGSSGISTGSVVVFSKTNSYYYILTNHHVIWPESGYNQNLSTYTVDDCYDQSYQATLMYRDVNYDLAILRINRLSGDKQPTVIEFSDAYYLNEDVVALGEPKGQTNTITYGEISRMYHFEADPKTADQSNIDFDVIVHSAKIDNGSSGGVLLDTNLKLIGINFASAEKNGVYQHSYAIPLAKVNEFVSAAATSLRISF